MTGARGSGTTENGGDFLSSLYKQGVKLWMENGNLRFQAPKGTLASGQLNKLRVFKAEIIELLKQTECPSDILLQPRPAGCRVPLTALQLLFWNGMQESEEKLSVRFCTTEVRITGPLNPRLLCEGIDALVSRHESLRTRFIVVDGVPTQCIDAAPGDSLQIVDLQAVPAACVEEEVTRLAQEFIHEKVDLSVGPLFAAKLFRISDCEHVLILAVEHLLSDGVSLEILDRELWTLYDQATRGQPLSLPHLPVQFADYAVWLQQTYDTWERKHAAYWKKCLRGAPCLKLPRDDGLLEAKSPVGTAFHFPFGSPLSVRLHDLAQRQRTLPAIVMLTIYVAVISRWHNRGDLVLDFVSNGRYYPELRDVVGLMIDEMHLRIEISKEDTFVNLLERVKLEFQFACEHPEFGHVRDLVPEYESDFSLSFNWQPANWIPWLAGHHWQFNEQIRIQQFPLTRVWPAEFQPLFFDTVGGISLTVMYRQDLFKSTTIERFAAELRLFAERCVENPLTSITSISMRGTGI